jgi:outer membrane protein
MRFSQVALLTLALAIVMVSRPAVSETIKEALALAYNNNPALNAQRASTRAADENVPLALSAIRPFIGASYEKRYNHTKAGGFNADLRAGSFGVFVSQVLWDSFRTRNNVESARAGIYASREVLRNTEQNVLFDAAAAYMDVLRDRAIAQFRAQNLEFLNELVRSEQARFNVGESTRTDVALAESQQAQAQSFLAASQARLTSSEAIYKQVIGVEPRDLVIPSSIIDLAPKSVGAALETAFADHPAILATRYLVDQADWNVRSAESDLFPTVDLGVGWDRNHPPGGGSTVENTSVFATLNIPIYQGGSVSATVRQSKEVLGQRRIEVDQAADNVRSAVISAYSQYDAADVSVVASEAQLKASQLALEGSIEERRVGQRTTLDVLQSQQDVIDAQIIFAESRREKIVAGYAVLSAIGALDAERLGLAVLHYDPVEHYDIVKDKWFGLRTPDGR